MSAVSAAARCAGVKAHADVRSNYTPGNKYTHWELRGVCVRLELGPKDMAASKVMAVRRDNGKKESIVWGDLASRVPKILEEMQAEMLKKASERVSAAMATVRITLHTKRCGVAQGLCTVLLREGCAL